MDEIHRSCKESSSNVEMWTLRGWKKNPRHFLGCTSLKVSEEIMIKISVCLSKIPFLLYEISSIFKYSSEVQSSNEKKKNLVLISNRISYFGSFCCLAADDMEESLPFKCNIHPLYNTKCNIHPHDDVGCNAHPHNDVRHSYFKQYFTNLFHKHEVMYISHLILHSIQSTKSSTCNIQMVYHNN